MNYQENRKKALDFAEKVAKTNQKLEEIDLNRLYYQVEKTFSVGSGTVKRHFLMLHKAAMVEFDGKRLVWIAETEPKTMENKPDFSEKTDVLDDFKKVFDDGK